MTTGELYLIRHGEAAGADDDDPGLSADGHRQAQALATRLAAVPVAGVLHSPRRRAVDTAGLLAAALPGVPVRSTSDLDDRTPVPSPGRRDSYPARYREWLDRVPNDERDVDGVALTASLTELVGQAQALAERGPLLAVTHAFVIGWFVRTALEAPAEDWPRWAPATANLTIIQCSSEQTRLISYDDVDHLG